MPSLFSPSTLATIENEWAKPKAWLGMHWVGRRLGPKVENRGVPIERERRYTLLVRLCHDRDPFVAITYAPTHVA